MGAAIFVPVFLFLLVFGFMAVDLINKIIKFWEKGSLLARFNKMWEKVMNE
jgi:hypothetical protein